MSPELEYAEEWRQVVGFEGYYEVSNLGRVRSVPRRDIRNRTITGGLKRWRLDRDGYPRVMLKKDGRGRPWGIHQLVTRAFLGPTPLGQQVDHIDGDRANPRLSNLRYLSPRANTRAALARGGGYRNPHGERNTMAKLTDVQVAEIRRLHTEGMSQSQIGGIFDVGQSQISRILSGKRRRFNSPPKPEGSA